MSMVKVTSNLPGTGQFALNLIATGPNTANVDIAEWPPGVKMSDMPPEKDDSFDLTNIVVSGGGQVLTCDGPSHFGVIPRVKIVVAGPNQPPTAVVQVSGTIFFDSNTVYPLSAADLTALNAWVSASGFPTA